MFNWLDNLVSFFVTNVLKIDLESSLGSSVHFFIYDVIKIIILLSFMIFLISYLRSFFPPERTKKIIDKFSGIKANIMASLLGIVTPFCSCSSVPLFIGFVEAGIPIGVTFSFLITSPIVNEAAFVILLAAFGWKIALLYVVTGVFVGVVGGAIIGLFNNRDQVEEYVYNLNATHHEVEKLTHKERVNFALSNMKDIIKRVYLFLLIGIGIGAVIHGWVPANFLSKYASKDNPLALLVAVIAGVPLYSNALGTIPIAQALINKGVAIGTALAFMMATTALSLPEMVILRKVIKPKLIAKFIIITTLGILFVGLVFNYISPYLLA
ncbi:MAG: permease [Pleomorphochaeta sp.]